MAASSVRSILYLCSMSDENPIDPKKITNHPGLLPFAHHVGSALIRPDDMGKVKGRALVSMEQQTHLQMKQIFEQMEKLAEQAERIRRRVEISHEIYGASIGFEPVIGQVYHLYERDNGKKVLSMIAPDEWGGSMPYAHHLESVKMLGDHTWEILPKAEDDTDDRKNP